MDIIGKTFGRLTILERVENNKHGQIVVKVICNCTNNTILNVSLYKLKDGHTKSCGCLQKEMVSTINKKYNKYDLTGEYGIGYTFKNEEFYFDLEDYDKIKDYCWSLNSYGYVKTKIKNTHIFLHRFVLETKNELPVDHINHIVIDNKKSNLRVVTHSQNSSNQIPRNKFGIKGMYWNKKDKVWDMRIKTKDGLIRERFKSLIAAINRRIELEIHYWEGHRYVWENDIDIEKLIEWENELKSNG